MRRVDVRDLPINSENEDLLNLKKYSDALANFIQCSKTPLTISLQGEWGSGKTSLMNILKTKLCDNDVENSYECIWINTWELYLQGKVLSFLLMIWTEFSQVLQLEFLKY